jgi:hypothetical protein
MLAFFMLTGMSLFPEFTIPRVSRTKLYKDFAIASNGASFPSSSLK